MDMRAVLSVLLSVPAACFAQSVISAHSGVVQYVEGTVTIDGQEVHPKFAEFPDVKPNQVLATADGRVEVLLTPGVFLRLAEDSSVRMISNSLSDTRLAVISGSALVEIAELLQNNAITFEAAGTQIVLPHKGLYRIDSDPARLRVYDGQARVGTDAPVVVRKGREVALDQTALLAKDFEVKDTDAFYRWSARRSEYVSEANLASARVASNPESSGYVGAVASPFGLWSWNPYFGMFTYLPGDGIYMSPFGYAFYSPIVAPYVIVPASAPLAPARPVLGGASIPATRSGLAAAPLGRPMGRTAVHR